MVDYVVVVPGVGDRCKVVVVVAAVVVAVVRGGGGLC